MIKKPFNYIIFFVVVILVFAFFVALINLVSFGSVTGRKKRDLTYNLVDEEAARKMENITHFDVKKRGQQIIKYNDSYYLIIKMGERSSGGYSIKVENVEIKKDKAIVTVKEEKPGLYCATTEAFTYPYAVIKFSRKPKVKVKHIFNTYNCNN